MTILTAITALSALLALVAAVAFTLSYSASADWWRSAIGISIVALDLCVAGLAIGTITRLLLHNLVGELIIVGLYMIVSAVILWRHSIMWRAQHPEKE